MALVVELAGMSGMVVRMMVSVEHMETLVEEEVEVEKMAILLEEEVQGGEKCLHLQAMAVLKLKIILLLSNICNIVGVSMRLMRYTTLVSFWHQGTMLLRNHRRRMSTCWVSEQRM